MELRSPAGGRGRRRKPPGQERRGGSPPEKRRRQERAESIFRSPVECVFVGGVEDYHSYLQFTFLRAEAHQCEVLDRELASRYWEARERVSCAYFNFYNASDLLRYSICSGVALVVGRMDSNGAFRTVFDNRVLSGCEPASSRYVLLSTDGEKAIIVRIPMAVRCFSYCESSYAPLPNFPAGLPTREEDMRAMCQELDASITFMAQLNSVEFRARASSRRNGRSSLHELVHVRSASSDRTVHVVLQPVQTMTGGSVELSALLVTGAAHAKCLPAAKSEPSFPQLTELRRGAAERKSYKLPLCELGRRPPPWRKLNFCCTDRQCEYCTVEAPEIFRAKGVPTGEMTRETSPLFDPGDINSSLELGNRIRACGLDRRYPLLLPKLAQVRRLSLVSFDIECFTHPLAPFPSEPPPPGVSSSPPGGERATPRMPAAVQLPFLIGVSTLAPDACSSDQRPALDRIDSQDFVLGQERGFPTADSLEDMVLRFFSLLLDLAVRRSEMKVALIADELARMEEFCALADADLSDRSKGHKMEGTFVGRVAPQLREAAGTLFVSGFNSGRLVEENPALFR